MPLFNSLKIGVAASCILLSSNVFSCEVDFEGALFFKVLHSKGAKPNSTCYETNLFQNSFFAFPDKSCEIVLPKIYWFNEGWELKGIQGKGTFDVEILENDITIKIEAAGGFRLISVKMHSNTQSCENVTVEMVL